MKISGNVPDKIGEIYKGRESIAIGGGEAPGILTDSFRESFTEGVDLLRKMEALSQSAQGAGSKFESVKEQCPAKYIGTDSDGRIHVEGVRWGFEEPSPGKPGWKPIFKETSIDPTKVKDVYLVIEPFAPEWIAAHAFTYFEFKDDGKLRASDGSESNGLALSVEANLKEGQKYDLIEGMKNKFGIVYQLGTWQDAVQKTCRKEEHKLIRYKLDLTQEQKEQLLRNGLEEAFKDRSGEPYNTITNSCFTNQARMLNTVQPRGKRIGQWIIPGAIYNVFASMPRTGEIIMGFKHVFDEKTPPVITQPDLKLHPGKQTREGRCNRAIRKLSEMKTMHALSTIGGIALGALAGTMIPPPGVGAIICGALGGAVASKTADWIQYSSHFKTEPSEQYFT